MRSPRRVTMHPMLTPARSLKFEIDLRALRMLGFWPVMVASSAVAISIMRGSPMASPTPMLTTIFSSRGTCITFLYPNSSLISGTICLR